MHRTLTRLVAVRRHSSWDVRLAVGALSVFAAAAAASCAAVPELAAFAVVAAALGALFSGRGAALLAAAAAGIVTYLVRSPVGFTPAVVAAAVTALAASVPAWVIGGPEKEEDDVHEDAEPLDEAEAAAGFDRLISGISDFLGSNEGRLHQIEAGAVPQLQLQDFSARRTATLDPAAADTKAIVETVATMHATLENLAADIHRLSAKSDTIGRSIDVITLTLAANLRATTPPVNPRPAVVSEHEATATTSAVEPAGNPADETSDHAERTHDHGEETLGHANSVDGWYERSVDPSPARGE